MNNMKMSTEKKKNKLNSLSLNREVNIKNAFRSPQTKAFEELF